MAISGFTSDNAPEMVVGEAFGKRVFGIDSLGRLSSVSNGYVWKPGKQASRCRYYKNNKEHRSANQRCSCGFWAYYDDQANDFSRSDRIQGIMAGSGLVTMGDRGFRAENARIEALVKPRTLSVDGFRRWGRTISDPIPIIFCWFWSVAIIMAIGFALMTAYNTVNGHNIWSWLGASSMFSILPALALPFFADQMSHFQAKRVSNKDIKKAFKKTREVYPDVRVFRSRRAMYRAYDIHVKPTAEPGSDNYWKAKAEW